MICIKKKYYFSKNITNHLTMKNLLFFIALFFANLAFSQIIIQPQPMLNFEFDEAGNQIYRGNGSLSKSNLSSPENLEDSNLNSAYIISEKEFWNNIRIYPVPVKDILTIDWTEKVDDLISNVGLFQQSTVHWVFQGEIIPSLHRKLQINMSKQYMGVYILIFTLKDGRRVSKNITKF